MSEWQITEVQFNDEKMLIEALKGMGYQPTVHTEAVDIKGYGSNVSHKAHIVISKGQFGGYTDCGFERTKTGFNVHMDNMDGRKFKLPQLKQHYSEAKINQYVRGRSKYSIKSREVDKKGRIRIRLRTL